MNKLFFLCTLFLVLVGEIKAQQLLTPSRTFSHKKTSYITLSDGKELQGVIQHIDRKKKLIEGITIQDGTGKIHELKPDDVKYMYLPPNNYDKLGKTMDFLTNAQKWNDEKLNQDFLNKGYVYFELADVMIKKNTMKLLVQLLNPGFSKVVKVYDDPLAKETMSLGLGDVKFVGGDAKSYYIAKGDKPAYRLKKKDYRKEFVPLWKKCDKLLSEYSSPLWTDLVKHIIAYSECAK